MVLLCFLGITLLVSPKRTGPGVELGEGWLYTGSGQLPMSFAGEALRQSPRDPDLHNLRRWMESQRRW